MCWWRGQDCAAVADAAAKIAGVEKVLLVDDAFMRGMLAEPMEALILSVADKYDAILAPATTTGKNYLPRVAAKLDYPQVSEIIAVIAPDTFERPIYAGNAIETVQAPAGKKIITVRTTTFAAAADGGNATVEKIAATADPGLSSFVEENLSKSERPELTSAKIVISGGRGLGQPRISSCWTRSPTGLARRWAASRAAVDAGYVPNDYPGRPDRQGRGARSVSGYRYFRRHPASGRHEGLQGDRRHQQGRRSADFPGRRLWPGGRSVPGDSRTGRRTSEAWHRSKRRKLMAVEKIGVIGAGQMGTGIAHVLALAGYDVVLDDINKDALSKALERIEKNMQRQAAKGADRRRSDRARPGAHPHHPDAWTISRTATW